MKTTKLIGCALGLATAFDVHAVDAQVGPPRDTSSSGVLEEIVVTGSHIKRTAIEGPAPVTMISAAEIRDNGYATVADVMSALTQNLGALDNNQNTDGYSPGAQAVDLRGLGPNHTLVLVNGRRIADYPQSYQGNSNFTDISNIPTSLIDHIEILSGSASAIYGSDAIAGVINFILNKKADGTTVDLRVGDTQHGGGASQRFELSSGYSNERFDSVFAVEIYNQDPLWAYQRDFTNSRLDSPGDPSTLYPSPVFVRTDVNGNYIDPGSATCASLSHLDQNSIIYAYQPNYGYYCGSYRDVGYGTLENGKKAVNVYGSATYRLNDEVSLFIDLQAGGSDQVLYNTPLEWQNSYILDDNSTPTPFYNLATGQIEQWQRQYFTLEENGGLEGGEIHEYNHTISLNTGLKGSFAGSRWDYEATFGFSRSTLESVEPALVAAKAQALYLGPSLGIDPNSGLNEYNAPVSRLYTPLTVAQFQSITQNSIDNDTSSATSVTVTATNSTLFELPAGPVGVRCARRNRHPVVRTERRSGLAQRYVLRLAQYERDRLTATFRRRRRIQRADLIGVDLDGCDAFRQLCLQRNDIRESHLSNGARVSAREYIAAARILRYGIPCAGPRVPVLRSERLQFEWHRLLSMQDLATADGTGFL